MHPDEIATDVALVESLLAGQYPMWANLPVTPVASTGTVNAIYRLGDDMCVRLPRVPSWERDLERELRWLPRLAPRLPMAVPEPLAKGRPANGYPFTWAVYRWIDGETFARKHVHDLRQCAVDLAAFVSALRSIDPAQAPASGRGQRLESRDVEVRQSIEASEGLFDTAAAATAWEQALRTPSGDGRHVWTHGDLLPGNMLVSRGRLRAIIDFGIAGFGDPAIDLLPAWSVLDRASRAVFRKALAVDEPTWQRGMAWALSVAIPIIPYYRSTNPDFVWMAMNMLEELLAEAE